jgi:hypothetical protein
MISEQFLQIQNEHPKADSVNGITVLECKQYSLFIFCSGVVKGRQMS